MITRSTSPKLDIKGGYYLRYYKKLDKGINCVFPRPN